MTDVFISYSRKDIAFARLLHEALVENQLETWIDWQDIPPSADWLAEVYEAIEGADAFVFVISETSLASEICGMEMAHAAAHNKRLIPIVIKDVEAEKVPKELSILNWIFFDDAGEKFGEAMEDLVSAITVDQAWVKGHTRFQNRALEWERKERDHGALLRGVDLSEAETWLASSASKDPQPTALQTEFILKSREDATRRQRQTLMGVGAALVVAVGLGILAWTQRNAAVSEGQARATAQAQAEMEADSRATQQMIAEEQRDIAEEQRSIAETQMEIAESRQLAAQGKVQIESHLDLALLLNVESCRVSQTLECRSGLLDALTYRSFIVRVLHSNAVDLEFNPITGFTSPSRVAFSPNSSLLAAATGDNTIVLWDVYTGERLGEPFIGHISEVTALAFSPDGKILASGTGYQTVMLWDVDTRKSIGSPLRGSIERDPRLRTAQTNWGINSLTFSADGEQINAGCGNEDIIVWDVTSGERIEEHLGQQPSGVPHWLHATAFNSDVSSFVSGLEDGSIAVYDVITGQRKDIMRLSYEGVSRFTALAYSPENQMVAGGDLLDDTIILWDLKEDKQVGQPLDGHSEGIYSLVFSPDGRTIASSGYDATIVLWDVEEGEAIGSPLTGHTAKVIGLDFSDDGRWLASLDTLGNTLLWNLAGERTTIARRFEGDPGANSIAFDGQKNQDTLVSAQCRGWSGDWGCAIRRWDIDSGTESADPIKVYWPEVVYPELSPDGAIMVTSGDFRVVLWDTKTGEQLNETFCGVSPIAFNPESEILAIWRYDESYYFSTKTITQLDIYRQQQIGDTLNGYQDDLNALVYSPNGEMLAGGSEGGEVMIWDLVGGDPVPQVFATKDEGEILDLAFSPDGSLLAASSEGAPVGDVSSIELWDVATGQSLWPAAPDQPEDVQSLIFSPDGTMLVSMSKNGSPDGDSIALWDVASGRMIGWLGVGGESILFSADNDTLFTADRSNIVLWDINLDVWQEHACQIANRNMTASEWETYLPDQPCRPTCPNLPDLCLTD